MARPRLDEEERRAQTVGVRVTAAEAAELRERAQAARLSMGAYLRRRALGQRVRKPSAVSKSTSLSGGLRSAAVVSSEKGLFRVFSGWPTGSRLLHPADPTSPAVTSEPKRRPRNPQIPYTPVRSWATRKGNKTLINRELSL